MGKTNRKPLEIGEKYGRLTVLEGSGLSKDNRLQYRCRCDCGNETIVVGKHLRSGNTKSCGCYKRDAGVEANRTHGLKNTPLYRVWAGMKDRCLRKGCKNYKNYGGRGISICDEWRHDFKAFYDWAMANGYADGLTIDRIDVNGDYCPENCRWATCTEQANNKRSNVFITFNGETRTLKEWSDFIGVNYYTLHSRYSAGRSPEEILTKGKLTRKTPVVNEAESVIYLSENL